MNSKTSLNHSSTDEKKDNNNRDNHDLIHKKRAKVSTSMCIGSSISISFSLCMSVRTSMNVSIRKRIGRIIPLRTRPVTIEQRGGKEQSNPEQEPEPEQ